MATEAEMRMHRVCFTGHRPEKLKVSERKVVKALEKEIDKAIRDGYTTYITGMARGVDIWAAEIILVKKKKHPELKLICALPYEGFENSWAADWQKRYRGILKQADLTRSICKGFSYSSYQVRNEWMVDHSARVIAVWNGEPSGTKNTIDYARKMGVEVINVSSDQ